jgi:hypothetical protein
VDERASAVASALRKAAGRRPVLDVDETTWPLLLELLPKSSSSPSGRF